MSAPLNLVTRPIAGLVVLVGQVLRAAHREDLPSLDNQDPSGVFGDGTRPALRIVVLGDSSVTAPGVEPLDDSWSRRLARALSNRHSVELLSVAVGGSKARDVLADQVEPALAFAPDMALLSVGANDALRATPVNRFEAEIAAVLDILTAHVDMVGVSGVGDLGTVPRLPTLAQAISRVRGRSIDGAIRRAAAAHPGVVKGQAWGDLWRSFEEEPHLAFAPDQFHASAHGHAAFASMMVPVAEALLARRIVSGSRENP